MSEILFPVLSEKNLEAGGAAATWFAPPGGTAVARAN